MTSPYIIIPVVCFIVFAGGMGIILARAAGMADEMTAKAVENETEPLFTYDESGHTKGRDW